MLCRFFIILEDGYCPKIIINIDTTIMILKNRMIFELGDNLLPIFQHGFLRSEENVNLNNTPGSVLVNVCPVIFSGHSDLINFPWQMLCHIIV